MNAAKRLKIIAVVMFCFIVVLVSLLVYVVKVAGDSKAASENSPADTTSISQSTGSSQASGSQQNGDSAQADDSSKGAGTDLSADTEKTIDLKLYYYDADDYDSPKEIRTVSVDKKQFTEDLASALNTLFSSVGITINKAVINEKNMSIDIPKETAKKFNSGSAGGITNTNILAMTALNLPGVEQLEVTVDGQSGVESDHFSFNGTFTKSQDGKKFDFNPSDAEGKLLDLN
jgi:cytoskeletal protein RodZ